MQDFESELTAFMDVLHLDTAFIAGQSMGSAVAMRFAIDHPDRTLGLVLKGASATMRNNPKAREYWDSVLMKLTNPVDPEFVREGLQKELVQPVPKEQFEILVRENHKVPVFVWRATTEARWRGEGDFAGQPTKSTAPTLIV